MPLIELFPHSTLIAMQKLLLWISSKRRLILLLIFGYIQLDLVRIPPYT